MQQVTLPVPREFSFERCFQFLKRSPHELLHRVEENSVVKLLLVNDELILISVKGEENVLKVEFLHGKQSELVRARAKQYVREWFDLETDLKPFYALARKDDLLRPLIKKFYGYRIVGQPDLFESLIWAVLGLFPSPNFFLNFFLETSQTWIFGSKLPSISSCWLP